MEKRDDWNNYSMIDAEDAWEIHFDDGFTAENAKACALCILWATRIADTAHREGIDRIPEIDVGAVELYFNCGRIELMKPMTTASACRAMSALTDSLVRYIEERKGNGRPLPGVEGQ